MSKISREDVERTAALAHLELSEDEVLRMTAELGQILELAQQLQALDTEGVPPTAHAIALATPMRPDVAAPPMDAELAVANAPDREATAFVVPKVIDADES